MARMVVAQALAIGIVGAGFAVVLGVGMSWAFVWGVLQAILGWQLESHFAAAAALSSASLGIAACLLGGLLPAIRASRISIASALRYE
jgi:ABC-type antimicrobial peptide transport system permease subunit